MAAAAEFTTTEASVVTEQPVNRIPKLIDAGPIPRRIRDGDRPTRFLVDSDLMFVWVLAHAFRTTELDASLKATIFERIATNWADLAAAKADEVEITPFVTIRGLRKLVDELRARIEGLERARRAVVSDARVKGGELVIRGTRVPVYLVASMLAQGATAAEIIADYPTLNEEKVELAGMYARANPRQGRPPKHAWR